jgi:glutamate racemase
MFILCAHSAAASKDLDAFKNREEVIIAVTDSGLGGMAVVAELSRRLKTQHPFRQVRIIFQNALFSPKSGYNSLTSRNQKIKIFNNCLESLNQNYRPDVILIACNTLSVLFDDTRFARQKKVPVKGVVEAGLALIAVKLSKSKSSQVAILGTETTIGEGTYQRRLVEMGFDRKRIIAQACPELQAFIERGFDSEETRVLISAYTDEVIQKKIKDAPLWVSFNCTHYGYALKAWQEAFAEFNCPVEAFLDPTPHMVDFIFAGARAKRFKETRSEIKVVSMVPIARQAIESLGRYFKLISPETAKALANYELKENLFEWKSIAQRP